MAKVKVTQKRNNTTEIIFSGELTIYHAMEIFQKNIQNIKVKGQVTIKLSGITEIDTSGIQLLIILFKTIKQQSSHYCIESMSDTVKDYINLFNLSAYFLAQDNMLEEVS